MLKNQKEIFLNYEGDNYFLRNKHKKNRMPHLECFEMLIKQEQLMKNRSILEIGCSNGNFLKKISKIYPSFKLFGLDPSKKALSTLPKKIKSIHGTADDINVKSSSIDVVIFGFCLYLIDKNFYKKINNEVNRVLKSGGFAIVYDFYSDEIKKFKYKHDPNIKVTKMNFSKIFSKKNFFCFYNKILNYNNLKFSLDKNNLISISILKKI
jgi:ubiquinone/menaquinone biosynthesis C-methylase UbiE